MGGYETGAPADMAGAFSKNSGQSELIKPLFSSQIDFYLKNLDRLIDQDTYWFCERIKALQTKDTNRVAFIEQSYLIPLQRKIKELAGRMAGL